MSDSDDVYIAIIKITDQVLRRLGISAPPVSLDVAAAITAEIRKYMRGNKVYFSCMTQDERKARRGQIRDDFDGTNYQEVCRKHQITRRTLYRALSPPRMADEKEG